MQEKSKKSQQLEDSDLHKKKLEEEVQIYQRVSEDMENKINFVIQENERLNQEL